MEYWGDGPAEEQCALLAEIAELKLAARARLPTERMLSIV